MTSDRSARAQTMYPVLAAVRHALHPALVTPAAFATVGSAMANLPDALTTLFYLETRLHDDSAVDLVLRVGAESRAILLDDRDASFGAIAGDAWERVRTLVRTWSDGRSALASALHHLWLEFDIDQRATSPRLVPGVFACFGELRDTRYTAQRWLQHAESALASLLGDDLGPAVKREVTRCFAVLPDDAYVPYVGVMLGRPADSVRICLTGLSASALVQYLRSIDWPSPIGDVEELVANLTAAQPAGPLQGAGMVHLDISAQGVWRLGLEFACQRGPQLRGELRERALLARLVALGLASREKTDALAQWPGGCTMRGPEAEGDRVIMRRVNHVKLVLRPDRAPEAKAYLAARHRPRALLSAAPRAGSILTPTSERMICS